MNSPARAFPPSRRGGVPFSSPESLIEEGLRELSLAHTPDHILPFSVYLAELKRWNRAYNLTSMKGDEDIIIKHFMDSLLYLKGLPLGEISVMDVGSGAGFPGIPLKIVRPEIKLYLLEPSRKRATFLRHVVHLLGLDSVEIIEKRIEETGSPVVDVAVTRALFTLKDFWEKASPVTKKDGRIIMSKGPKVKEELVGIEGTGIDYEMVTMKLPLTGISRHIVIMNRDRRGHDNREKSHRVCSGERVSLSPNTCVNAECRLRKAGCRGFEGCPGFISRQ